MIRVYLLLGVGRCGAVAHVVGNNFVRDREKRYLDNLLLMRYPDSEEGDKAYLIDSFIVTA